MKRIILTILLLSASIYSKNIIAKNISDCKEYRLGGSNTYIVSCKDGKYKVTYDGGFKNKVIELVELGKNEEKTLKSKNK